MTHFADNLRRALKEKGCTQEKLADLTGITRATISKYLCNQRSLPRVDKAMDIARALGVTIENLLLDTQVKNGEREDCIRGGAMEIIGCPETVTKDTLIKAEMFTKAVGVTKVASTRTYKCLKSANIHTVGDLMSKSVDDLLELKDFGSKALRAVYWFLKQNKLGCAITEEVEPRIGCSPEGNEPVSTKTILTSRMLGGSHTGRRVLTWLHGGNIRTVGDLITVNKNDLERLRSCDRNTLQAIRTFIAQHGFSLSDEVVENYITNKSYSVKGTAISWPHPETKQEFVIMFTSEKAANSFMQQFEEKYPGAFELTMQHVTVYKSAKHALEKEHIVYEAKEEE